MSESSLSGIGGMNRTFKASDYLVGVVAIPEAMTRLKIDSGDRGRRLLSFAHFASGYTSLLHLAALNTTLCNAPALLF